MIKEKNKSVREPIAIIGIGLRLPGGANSAEDLWNILLNKVDAIIDTPSDRWNYKNFFDADIDRQGKIIARQGGFLKNSIYEFDPLFFGISPREAEELDPQQRLLLEISFEAFEDCGIRLEDIKGTNTGVYIGGFLMDNQLLRLTKENKSQINASTPAGITLTMLSNKLSYIYDLHGPSISVRLQCQKGNFYRRIAGVNHFQKMLRAMYAAKAQE